METINSVIDGYKKNWMIATIGAIGGFLIVKKAFNSGNILAIGTGVLVGSLVGSTISITSKNKSISSAE